LEAFGLPTSILPEIVPPGTTLGGLRPVLAEELGLSDVSVIAPACHDTGSAVAAVPAEPGSNWAFISSGTWSLMGMEVKDPIINATTLRHNFTNEGGVAGTFRFLKNIMGLWLVQECRREWIREGKTYDYAELVDMAAAAPAFGAFVSPGDTSFLHPGDMSPRIQAYCQATGQTPPQTKAAILRTALESLALEYRWVAERLDALTGKSLSAIHIIGGGSKNELLDQFAADATGRTVITGPVEATALGNVLVQAIALGHLGSLAEGRDVVKRSFELKAFTPRDTAAWDEAYARYLKIRR
jgi:rhamnulokinase